VETALSKRISSKPAAARKYSRKHITRSIFVLVLACLLQGTVHAEEKRTVTLGGHIRNFATLVDFDGDATAEALSLLRLRLLWEPSPTASGELAYELTPRLRETNGPAVSALVPVPPLFSYRAVDLEDAFYEESENFSIAQNLDRAMITLRSASLDFFAGRQPIAFGSARAVNPTDVIVPFAFNTLAKEERAGVDALRAKLPFGQLGELDAGVVSGDDFEPKESAAFVRLKSYVLRTDASAMTMAFRENLLLGIDLARSIGGAGAWFEAAYVFTEEGSDENYLRLSAGADYSLTAKLYGYVEYHFNGAGAGRPEEYFNVITETAYADGAVYLLGRHYLAPGFTYELMPLLVLSAQALVNLEDGSLLPSPVLEYSAADDVTMKLGAFLGVGSGPDGNVPRSEFGLYPDLYFASLNIYF
jgi:hypothetical protein